MELRAPPAYRAGRHRTPNGERARPPIEVRSARADAEELLAADHARAAASADHWLPGATDGPRLAAHATRWLTRLGGQPGGRGGAGDAVPHRPGARARPHGLTRTGSSSMLRPAALRPAV